MEYHQDRFDDSSLLVFKGDQLVAVLPANKVGNEIHSHQGLTYGGLVLNKTIKFKDVLECFKTLLKFLHDHDFVSLKLKQLPVIYTVLPNDEVQYLAFLTQGVLTRRDTLSVVKQKEKLKFSKDRREGSKRGVKHNLIVREDDNFDDFWNDILSVNLLNKHKVLPVHSLDEIKLLKKRFPNNIRQFNVYHDNKIVAGTTIFETQNVAHSQYISGDDNKNNLGSLDFLHAHLINEVFSEKAYFDFGISNENDGQNLNMGLQYWKEGFGARTIVQDFFSIKTANYKLLDTVLK